MLKPYFFDLNIDFYRIDFPKNLVRPINTGV